MMSPTPSARWLLAVLLLWTSGRLAQAHPGHALREAPATHLLTSPYHLALLVLGGALVGLIGGRCFYGYCRRRDGRVS